MLKGQVFAKQLFENQIFALFVNTFLNGNNGVSDNYADGMEVTYSGSNITIGAGAVCIQGRFLEEDTYTTLSAGTDNNYCRLVIEIDLDKTNTESDFQQGYYKILTSSTGYPALTQSDIVKNNAGVYQYELAQFRTSANGITDFIDKRTFLDFDSIYDEIEQHIHDIDDGNVFLTKTGGTTTGTYNFGGQIKCDNITDADGSAFINSNKIATITGTISLTNGTGSTNLNYPEGFNSSNCIPLTVGLTIVTPYSYFSHSNMVFSVRLTSSNVVVDCNAVDNVGSTATKNVKVVLLKIS